VADQRVEKNKSAQSAAREEYIRKLEEARGEVNKMVADADGEYRRAQIEADVYYEKQELLAQAIKAEGIAEAKGIEASPRQAAGNFHRKDDNFLDIRSLTPQQATGLALAYAVQEMNKALTGSGGEALVKLRIAEALQDKQIVLLPVSEGGMNLKTTDINQLINTIGLKGLSSKEP
jgi:hypothetical protein